MLWEIRLHGLQLLCVTGLLMLCDTRRPQLLFSDEFNGAALDRNKWEAQVGNGCQYHLNGWGNAERCAISAAGLEACMQAEAEAPDSPLRAHPIACFGCGPKKTHPPNPLPKIPSLAGSGTPTCPPTWRCVGARWCCVRCAAPSRGRIPRTPRPACAPLASLAWRPAPPSRSYASRRASRSLRASASGPPSGEQAAWAPAGAGRAWEGTAGDTMGGQAQCKRPAHAGLRSMLADVGRSHA